MARRHPILSLAVIVLIVVALVHFSRSFDTTSALQHVKQVTPGSEAAGGHSDKSSGTGGTSGTSHVDKEAVPQAAAQQLQQAQQAQQDALKQQPPAQQPQQPQQPPQQQPPLQQPAHQPPSQQPPAQQPPTQEQPVDLPLVQENVQGSQLSLDHLAAGKPIMGKMPNQTIRAEVGNAGWKLLHTILSQYPEEPSDEDKQTLGTFLKFFSRVYPCRECAEHFQDLLDKTPPQLSSRKVAVMWGCDAHNKVNKRLGKEIFDCAYIFDKYDCGCGSDPEAEGADLKPDLKPDPKTDPKTDLKPDPNLEKTELTPLQRGGA